MNSTNQEGFIEVRAENGLVVFDSYQQYKQRAIEARDYLLSLDVKPESEQECKKVVAAARKISEKLNQESISEYNAKGKKKYKRNAVRHRGSIKNS